MPNANPKYIEKFYLRYEHLASTYASQIFNFERNGYERQDVVQELRIKIYNSIIAYCKKWTEYRATGRYKPVPIEFYIKTALVNRTKDFIREFNYETVENCDKISIQRHSFDYAEQHMVDSDIDLNKCVCEINGVDLMKDLTGNQRKCFSLYIKGFTITKLKSMFSKQFNAELVIQNQIKYLRTQKETLMSFDSVRHEMYVFDEE
jgi:hypothetical protein